MYSQDLQDIANEACAYAVECCSKIGIDTICTCDDGMGHCTWCLFFKEYVMDPNIKDKVFLCRIIKL